MRMFAMLVLVALLGLVGLSAATADALGLQATRMVAFTALFATLAALAFATQPATATPVDRAALALLALLGAMLAQDAHRPLGALDLKPALPVAALLAGPRVALLLRGVDLAKVVWWLLSTYVTITALLLLSGSGESLREEASGVARWDVTGSVIAHGSLCAIHAILALSITSHAGPLPGRTVAAALGLLSLSLAFLTGSRTVLAILSLFLFLAALRRPTGAGFRLAVCTTGLVIALTVHSALVSDGLAQRLLGTGADYSSGRWQSSAIWLGMLAEQPLGIGLGGVRATLAAGRPALDGDALLEWPHNELIRLTVESGPLGLVFVLGLLALLVRRAWQAARMADSPLAADLALVLAADLIAESLLQNLLNSVYQATTFVLLIAILAARPTHASPAALTAVPIRR